MHRSQGEFVAESMGGLGRVVRESEKVGRIVRELASIRVDSGNPVVRESPALAERFGETAW